MIRQLLQHMQAVATMHGATLTLPHTLRPDIDWGYLRASASIEPSKEAA